MDIKTFVNVVSALPKEISVLAKGPTGIGKSQIFHQVGKRLKMPVIDRRLAQMTEGDIIGLPELVDGVTRFAPCDWFIRACKEPVILFFDELNRATLEVQQCAFQIVLDRELNGHKLHADTRVYAAVNVGSDYQVLEMDPALQRRFWAMDLEPTTQDWLDWAKTCDDIPASASEYIKKFPSSLRHVGQMEPGKVYPNPASWHRLMQSLTFAGMNPDDICGSGNLPELFYPMCLGFIGQTDSVKFSDFIKEYVNKFFANDIIDSKQWSKKKKAILEINNDKKNGLMEQIVDWTKIDGNTITIDGVDRCVEFVKSCSEEMIVNFFNLIMETEDLETIKKFHKRLGKLVTDIINESGKY
jgi:hypothetical protein|tara:strand:- start:5784 stop:6851 length:1068 start_codon:yes stop_codon:yes gene_type:complete